VSPTQLAVVAAAVLVAALVQSTTSFGFALLAVPLASLVVAPEEAVVLSVTLGLLTSTSQAVGERADLDVPVARRMLLALAAGAPFGLLLLEVTTSRQLKFVLAAVIFTFLGLTLRGVTLHRAGRAVDVVAGLVSGVLNTALSTNGPPVVMALHARQPPPARFRATVAGVLAGGNVVAIVLFAVTGRYDADVLRLVAVSLPALAVGYVIGARQRRRVDPLVFRRLVLLLLSVTGVVTLAGAVLG
jgi:uncharacterized membrane protein YfcA